MANRHHVIAPEIPRLGGGGARVCRTYWDTRGSAPLPVLYAGFDLVKLNVSISSYRIRCFPFSRSKNSPPPSSFKWGKYSTVQSVSWVCREHGLLDVVTVLLATLCALKFSRSPLLEDMGTEVQVMGFQKLPLSGSQERQDILLP